MSDYRFRMMEDEEATQISGWHYDPPYDFYDATSDPDDLEELLDPKRRKDAYFSVFDDEGVLVGFFQFERDNKTVDVGLGMRPDLTGRGLGIGYLLAGLKFARRRYSPERFTLSVATFNERAILVYERAGFRRDTIYKHNTDGGEYLFLSMVKEA
ncbi:MAG TPA: GNAT family protein [Rubrobacter sp.]|jgi:ribosomal-protein-alanine N-acetyltransferase|nr:GNAT family protein [Rubrobacter sp.]